MKLRTKQRALLEKASYRPDGLLHLSSHHDDECVRVARQLETKGLVAVARDWSGYYARITPAGREIAADKAKGP